MTLAPPAGEGLAQREVPSLPQRVVLVESDLVVEAPRPPLELALLAGALRAAGVDVEVIDLRVEPRARARVIAADHDGALLWGSDPRRLDHLAAELRAARGGLALRIGGPRLDAHAPLAPVEGLARPDLVPSDFPGLSRPAWDLLGPARYARPVPLLTGLSCGPGCRVCHHSFGYSVRNRALDDVLAEVDDLAARGVRALVVEDRPFNLDPVHAARVLEGIAGRGHGLQLSLAHPLRADRIDPALAAALAAARVRRVDLQLGGTSPRAQREQRLNLCLEAARRGIEHLRAAGVRARGRFTLGWPGETPAEHRGTVTWASRSALDAVEFEGGPGARRAWLRFHLDPARLLHRVLGWLPAR